MYDDTANGLVRDQRSQRRHRAVVSDLAERVHGREAQPRVAVSTLTSASTASVDRICDRPSITCWTTLTSS